MKLATAFVEVRPDTKGFRPELDRNVTNDAKAVQEKLRGVLAGGAFLLGAKQATETASRLQQAVGGTAAVFGEAEDAVVSFAKGAAESAGLSERAARELTSSLGGLLKGFGFTNAEAADLSVTLAKLGADLAATFGGTPEEAVRALGAALRGETDPLERFGIALNQTLVNQRAVELGLAATTSAVDQHAKAQATLSLITERSADAQGQFARESETAAGQAAISAAKMENSAADLGTNLLPVYSKIAEVVGTLADVFGSLPEPVQTALIVLGGIVALSGPTRLAVDAIGSLATITRTALAKGLDTAAIGAFNLSGNLGKVVVGAGALGVALAGASIILDSYQRSKANAARLEQAYTDILSEQTDEVAKNTEAFAGAEILKGELGEALREAGVNVGILTAGITESTDEVSQLNEAFQGLGGVDELGDLEVGLRNAGLEGSAFADELIRLRDEGALTDGQLNDLLIRLGAQADAYKVGAREAENKATADAAAGKAAGDATPQVAGLTEELDDNEQAAKDAAESVDLFREAVERALQPLNLQEAQDQRTQAFIDLAEDIEARTQAIEDARRRISDLEAGRSDRVASNTRAIADAERNLAEARARVADTDSERAARVKAIEDAERALARVREDAAQGDDTERELIDAHKALQEAIDDTSLALDGETEAALRNRDLLRELVENGVDVIETAREQGETLENLLLIRANERDSLRETLRQLGFNEEAVESYVQVLDEIPLTKETTLTVDSALAEIQLQDAIARLQRQIDLNPLSIDVLQAEKFVIGSPTPTRGFAAGGFVPDGLFQVHDGELMAKSGSNLRVIAGAPTPVLDGINEEQLLVLLEQNELIRALLRAVSGSGIEAMRGLQLELT